jgi:hypothetical protein
MIRGVLKHMVEEGLVDAKQGQKANNRGEICYYKP